MEKLGTTRGDLLKELKEAYQGLKEKEATLVKQGAQPARSIETQLEGIREKIDELEESHDGGSGS
jgi:hypothetical protein